MKGKYFHLCFFNYSWVFSTQSRRTTHNFTAGHKALVRLLFPVVQSMQGSQTSTAKLFDVALCYNPEKNKCFDSAAALKNSSSITAQKQLWYGSPHLLNSQLDLIVRLLQIKSKLNYKKMYICDEIISWLNQETPPSIF